MVGNPNHTYIAKRQGEKRQRRSERRDMTVMREERKQGKENLYVKWARKLGCWSIALGRVRWGRGEVLSALSGSQWSIGE